MPLKAGVLTIDVNAGTAKFMLDMDKVNAKVREFGVGGASSLRQLGDAGHGAVSGVQATSGALRVLEGNITNNLRASERFIANVLHLGPVLQAAFPLIGAIAFGGMLVEIGKKVYDFFKTAEELPKKMAFAFRDLNEPLKMTNDQLLVTNDRLANDIAKLEGRRQNTLKLSLDEARVAADHLAESLDKDLKAVDKILKENNVSFMQRFFGQAGTEDLKDEFGEKNRQQVDDINDRGQAAIEKAATNPDQKIALRDVTAAQKAWDSELLKHYGEQLAKVNKLTEEANTLAKPMTGRSMHVLSFDQKPGQPTDVAMPDLPSPNDERTRLAALLGLRRQFQYESDHITNNAANRGLVDKKNDLEPGAEAARKYSEELKRLQQELAKATEMQLTGLQRVAEEERDETYRLQQAGQLNATTAKLVREIYDAKRLTVYAEEMQKLNNELAETAKRWQTISVESSKAFGEFFKTEIEASTKTLEEHGKAVTKLAEEYNKLTQQAGAQSLQHRVAMVTAGGDHGDPLGALAQQQALQAADIQKRYEGSLVAINSRLAELWREQLRTLSQITGVDQAHVNVEAIGNINLEKANLLRERNLQLLALQNEMEQKTAEVRQKGVGDFFKDMQGQAQTVGNIFYESMHSGLDQISDQFAKLLTGQKTNFGKMFQDLGEQMISKSIKSVAMQGLGKLGDAFGIHGLGGDVKHVIVDNMPAGGGLAGGIAGGGNAAGGGVGSVAGAGGNWFQKLIGGGSSSNLMDNGQPGSSLDGFAGTYGGSIYNPSNLDNTLYMAEGGDVDPGRSYIVGDGGEPEMFTPKSAGTITPAHKIGGTTVHNHSYTIDARGAQLGTENRISAAISAAHSSAITGAVRSSDERSKRTPQRKAA